MWRARNGTEPAAVPEDEGVLAATIGTVGALVADAAAPEDPVAVTVDVSVCPASLETGVYVAAVAAAIFVPFPAH